MRVYSVCYLCNVCVLLISGLPHGLYAIRNLLNCPHDDWCGAELSIDGAAPRPYATVEWTDPVDWELIPQGEDLYYIRTTWGCPAGKWCHAYLSWDPTGTHPRASLEHGATTLWRITTREDGWLIESRKDCPDGRWCGAELSWDGRSGTHPQASVEFNDPINWKIEQLKGKIYHIEMFNELIFILFLSRCIISHLLV